MIKVLKNDKYYSREKVFVNISFWDCTKISSGNNPTWVWNENILQHYCLIYTSEGNIEFFINRNRTEVSAGSTLLIIPNNIISAKCLTPSAVFWILMFDCDDFIFFPMKENHITAKVSNGIMSLLYQLNSSLTHSHNPQYYCDATVIMILEEVKRHIVAEPTKQFIYENLCKYISDHISEGLDVQTISARMNYNSDYLCRIVRECTNTNIQQLIIEEKVNTSKNLLKITNYSTEKIASMIGIESGNYFVKFFKYHTGETPGSYRNRMKNF